MVPQEYLRIVCEWCVLAHAIRFHLPVIASALFSWFVLELTRTFFLGISTESSMSMVLCALFPILLPVQFGSGKEDLQQEPMRHRQLGSGAASRQRGSPIK